MARESDLAYWFDVATDLLQRPLTEFPAADLAPHLHHSFQPTSLSWAWRETEGDHGFAHLTADGSQVTPTTPTTPTTAIDSARARDRLDEHLVPFGSEQQVPICYHMRGGSYGAFVLTRTCAHFDPDERDLARRLRHLMAGLYAQVRTRARSGEFVPPETTAQSALTGTEAAVLSLLAQGYTAPGIARRLSNSPRTVHKHLEHIYRKLGVSDRLMAVQVAADLARAGRRTTA